MTRIPTTDARTIRSTTQRLAPVEHAPTSPGSYDMYPSFPLGPGRLGRGHSALATRIAGAGSVVIDGAGGVLWEHFRDALDRELRALGIEASWIDVREAMLPPGEIDRIIAPFLGGDDPLWGTHFAGELAELFDRERLLQLREDPGSGPTILYGEGAALAGADGLLLYLDVPKNEIQFRSRAGSIRNLGAAGPLPAKEMYKRFYFVDWPALRRHRALLVPLTDIVVDVQRPDEPVFIDGADLRGALATMAGNYFRPRPWFEPGPWGGQWIKAKIPALPQEAPNYAWSFELIAPENGIMLESDGALLEVSLDMLLLQESGRVLGRAGERFGTEFPIRFDFLDTVDGGNLSVQVHPRTDYIRKHFGERFTQDETYYILDCEPGARVYLGFRENIDPAAFRAELERSRADGCEIDVERFVNTVEAHRHDLFLIPNGTIHCSGRGNLVLEVSATPYIFTFKMYDWVRRDLEGNLRPINIERAFDNLDFTRTASVVERELVAQPRVTAQGEGWREVHLPTHRDHFYDVRRFEFKGEITIDTNDDCHVMSLVEGSSIILETASGMRQRFNYAETFVVPAAAERYRLINEGNGVAMVVQAYVKGGGMVEGRRDEG
jgi:mannose-6-phosphate isomerase class I